MILARPVLLLYFGTLILIVAILIMNVVTAVLVNGALEQANEDKETQVAEKEAKKVTLLKALHDMFERMDEDKSGKLTRDELVSASQKDNDFFHEFLELKDPVESSTNWMLIQLVLWRLMSLLMGCMTVLSQGLQSY